MDMLCIPYMVNVLNKSHLEFTYQSFTTPRKGETYNIATLAPVEPESKGIKYFEVRDDTRTESNYSLLPLHL